MTGSSLEELAGLWREAWTSGEREAFAACCAARVRYEDPIAGEPLEGLDALAEHAERYRDAFPDLRMEPSGQPVIEERFGCVPWPRPMRLLCILRSTQPPSGSAIS